MLTGQERLAQLATKVAVEKTVAAVPSSVEFDTVGVIKLAGILTQASAVNPAGNPLLQKCAEALRVLAKQRDYLIEELSERMQEKSASAFAKEMIERGIWTREDLDQKVADLMKIGNLNAVKQAVELLPKASKAPSIGEVDKEAQALKEGMDKKYAEDPAVQFLLENPA